VLDLLDAMDLSDEMLKEHPRAAVQRSVIDVFSFIIAAGRHRRDLGLAPPNSHLPGDALARLVMAITDLNKDIVDPVLAPMANEGARRGRHTLSQNDQLDRVRPVVAMELLIMAGYGVKEAAKTVAGLLKGQPILADVTGDPAGAITRWRTVIRAGGDSWDTTSFNTLIAEAKSQVAARGSTAADYIKLVHSMFGSNAEKP
jgi:hypothetical protein